MRGCSNSRYSKEFRNEAAKLVMEGGMSVYEASRQLSLPKSTFENRV
jgi:transposase